MSTPINILRGAALNLDAMMNRIEHEAAGFDEHHVMTFDHFDQTTHIRQHLFTHHCFGRLAAMTEELICSASPWTGELRFEVKADLPSAAPYFFHQVVKKEATPYRTLFTGNGSKLELGMFFSRSSILKDDLMRYLESFDGEASDSPEIGIHLWKLIQRHGGLKILLSVWDDLYENVILPQMLMMDPFCFDPEPLSRFRRLPIVLEPLVLKWE